MVRQCAWCREVIGQTAPLDDRAVTHGICPACSARVIDEARSASCPPPVPPVAPPPAPVPAGS
jgi:hypothetical protein